MQFPRYRHYSWLIAMALVVSGCQTDSGIATVNSWSFPQAAPHDDRPRRPPQNGTSLRSNTYAGEPTFVEGTGRFIGTPVERATTQDAATEDGVTLNLVNVPAPQAAKAVLSDILAARYSVDPGIEGKITIQTPRPIPKMEALQLFEAALRANNAAMIQTNGMYRIVPIDQAALGAPIQVSDRSVTSSSPSSNKPGSAVQVVQLKYVSAGEMRRVLEPIVPKGSIVRVDDARNTITLSGNSTDISTSLDSIALFDVDVMKGMSFAFFPVATSQPDAIVDELRTIFGSDREGPMAGMVRFLPNKRLKAILVISPQKAYLTRAGTWIKKLDARAEGSEKQFYTYSVQNRRAQELVDVIQSILSKETGSRSSSGARNVAPQLRETRLQSTSNGSGSSAIGSGSSSTAFGNRFAGVQQSAGGGYQMPGMAGSQGAMSTAANLPIGSDTTPTTGPDRSTSSTDPSADEPRIKLVADDAKNAILIEATRSDYRRIMRVIDSLDVLPTQVMIEATIAEVTLNDQLKFGVRWYLNSNSGQFNFNDLSNGAVSAAFPGFSYAFTAAKLIAAINALNTITDVNIISSPTLAAMDSKTAYLQIGDQVPITSQSATSVITPGAPIVNSVSYKDTGVILSITPRINESGRVLLDIEQEVSNVVSTTTSGIDSPTISQRRIRTSVVVNNGEGLALGGMVQDRKSVSHTQMPIVGDIPIVGNAFKFKDNRIDRTELIVIITPHVMRNLNEARVITDEFRKQFMTFGMRDYHVPRPVTQSIRRTFE